MTIRVPRGRIPRTIPWDKIAIDRNSGMTWESIAHKYGVSVTTLNIRRGESPVILRERAYRYIPWDMIAIDRNSGMTWESIAHKYGFSVTTLHRRMSEFMDLSNSDSGGVSVE